MKKGCCHGVQPQTACTEKSAPQACCESKPVEKCQEEKKGCCKK